MNPPIKQDPEPTRVGDSCPTLTLVMMYSRTKADPLEPDCWKRRGQTRAALGHAVGALSDLDRAVELFNGRDPDVLHQRGMVYHKVRVLEAFFPSERVVCRGYGWG